MRLRDQQAEDRRPKTEDEDQSPKTIFDVWLAENYIPQSVLIVARY